LKGQLKKYRLNNRGYCMIDLSVNDVPKTVTVHQVCFVWHKRKNVHSINHIDGNKLNNAIINLEESTPKKQTKHAIEIGLMSSGLGELNHRSVLTAKDVVHIKKMLLSGVRQQTIADKFGVGSRCISKIKTGIRWGHI